MTEFKSASELIASPFITSFIGQAREGDLADPDQGRRASAWAQWAITNLTLMTGANERHYGALVLPGRFYDPKGRSASLKPHLEIPVHVMDHPDKEFPQRLAQMGNILNFPWWVMPEATALRRALFNRPWGSVEEVVKAANDRRASLIDQLENVSRLLSSSWSVVENKLTDNPQELLEAATGDFSTQEIMELFPPAENLNLKVVYDKKMREGSGATAARRVGIWQVQGENENQTFALGVGTPRLTANSLFRDPLFSPQKESSLALMVRVVLLRRVVKEHLGKEVSGVALPSVFEKTPGGPYLRAIVAKMGSKMPQASNEAAVLFLQSFPDGEIAWRALNNWASNNYLLTVNKDSYLAAHKNAARYIRRSEEPKREDIDVILPLAWDQGPTPRVVRVTFARGNND